MLIAVLLAMFGLAGLAPIGARAFGRGVGYPLAGALALAAIWLGTYVPRVIRGADSSASLPWVPSLGIRLTLVLDGLAMLFALLVLGIGALVMAYSARYLKPGVHGRFYSLLTLFAASMLGLVLAGDVVLLFVFWELTSIISFFLIGGDGRGEGRRAAARAFLVTGLGGVALFAGLLLLAMVSGSFDLRTILDDPGTVRQHALASAILVLILVGAFTKSAQVPFHFWLPGAMVAPTPVSTYLHAATMVKAGIYLLAKMSPLFAGTAPWLYALVLTGLVTAVTGAALALKQHDLKALLAYSTVSQLGFITALIGVGTFPALAAAALHTVAHASYKSTLFMVVGIIDREAGSRDIRRLSGLRRLMPITATITGLAAMSMAGVPPLLGFVSKEEAFSAFLAAPGGAWLVPVATGLAVAAAVMTFAYGARIFEGAFGGPVRQTLYEPAASFFGPAGVTALAGVGLGLAISALDPFFNRIAHDTLRSAGTIEMSLWHGPTGALGLSGLAIGLGVVMFGGRRRVTRAFAAVRMPFTAEVGFDRMHDGVVEAGRYLGRPFLSRSPAPHLGWVFGTTAVVGVAAWALVEGLSDLPVPTALPTDWVVAALLAISVVAVCVTGSRIAAVAVLGVAGFLIAVLYVLLGAPDLGLTQLLIETLTIVLVVLVFRRLPATFRRVSARRRLGAFALAATMGLLAVAGTQALTGRRGPSEAGAYFLVAAPTEVGGNNVVNAILVDFRALDTLGELTVVGVAALGVMAVARGRRRSAPQGVSPPLRLSGRPEDGPETGRWMSTLILTATTRALTPFIWGLSVYLLLRGHDAPGGGFIAALVAGAAVVLRYLALGPKGVREFFPGRPSALLGAGILLAVGFGLAGLVLGSSFLQGTVWRGRVPVLGDVKLAASLVFDVGVYLVVLGAIVGIVRRLGEEE